MTRHSFQSLNHLWESLLGSSLTNSVFLSPQWQEVWWDNFGAERELLLLEIGVQGQVYGIAPLQRTGNAISFLGDTDLFDYHDFIVPKGQESGFYGALVQWLESESWSELKLSSLPEDSPTLSHLPGLLREHGWTCEITTEDVVPGLDLPSDMDGYLQMLGKKDRHELRRKTRRLWASGDVRVVSYTTPEMMQLHAGEFFDLMRKSRDEKRAFLNEERERFFREIMNELAGRGILQLWFLEMNGKPTASAVCFDYDNKRLLYNSGFDHDYASLSVGLLIKAICLQDAIEKGMKYFDFLRGDETYKYHMGGKQRFVWKLQAVR